MYIHTDICVYVAIVQRNVSSRKRVNVPFVEIVSNSIYIVVVYIVYVYSIVSFLSTYNSFSLLLLGRLLRGVDMAD